MRRPSIGAHGNAWLAASAGAGTFSAVVDLSQMPYVSAFGNSSAASTLTLQYSQDGINFYDGANQVLAGVGDFRLDAFTAARFVRLKTSAAATLTATIAGKG